MKQEIEKNQTWQGVVIFVMDNEDGKITAVIDRFFYEECKTYESMMEYAKMIFSKVLNVTVQRVIKIDNFKIEGHIDL